MSVKVSGDFDACFEPLVCRFEDHLNTGLDTGAALAVYVDGRKQVDVWGGVADPASGTDWTEETLAIVYSCSTGVLALCLLHLVESRQVKLDTPVADSWPEFAHAGKESITLGHVLAHRAGLPLLEASLRRDEILSWEPVTAALESQSPLWPPGTGFAYHALTIGWLIGEVVRRMSGKLPGDYLRTELTPHLGLETWVGLPESEHHRVAPSLPSDPSWTSEEAAKSARDMLRQDDRPLRAVTLNGAMQIPLAGVQETCDYNRPEVWSSCVPAVNCITTARSLAKLYAAIAAGVDDHAPLLSSEVVRETLTVRSEGPMEFGPPGLELRYGLGFMLSSALRPMLGPTSFGHDGASGALAFADREARTSFTYIPNRMGGLTDTRANDLAESLRSCLG